MDSTVENLARVIAQADDATLDYERRRPDYDKEPWEGYVLHAAAVVAFLTSDEAVDQAIAAWWLSNPIEGPGAQGAAMRAAILAALGAES